MNKTLPSVIRACFKHFLGEDEYRKFLEAGATEPLKFWQEKEWERFVVEHPSLSVSSMQREEVFNVCPAHEKELLVGYTESTRPYNFAPNPNRCLIFPYAPFLPLVPIGVCCIRYCPQCIEVKAAYDVSHQK